MKRTNSPHYLLFSDAHDGHGDCIKPGGRWRFVLESVDGMSVMQADEEEPDAHGERLELLCVVRGLEALDQPSRVTLVTPSRYVRLGLRFGLAEWRVNRWQWEHFGRLIPVKNRDLWQRVDHALRYHQVDCRCWRFDASHAGPDQSACGDTPPSSLRDASPTSGHVASAIQRPLRWFSTGLTGWRGWLARRLPARSRRVTLAGWCS